MFYSRSNFRSRVISLLLPIVQLLVLTSLTLKMFTKSQSLKFFQTFFRSICRICKDIFAGVIFVKYFFKYIAVMNGRWSNFVLANKFVLNVYFYMVFAAKVILSIFLNPISISIFMTAFFLTPIFWNFPVLYLPSYSTNLNLIERFWKYLKEKICTTYYEHFGEFKKAITDLLDNIGKYKDDLISLLAPNFHIMDTRIL